MRKREKVNSNWIAGIFAIAAAQIFLAGFLKIPAFSAVLERLGNQNLIFYVIYLGIFVISFFAVAWILKKCDIQLPGQLGPILGIGTLVVSLLFLLCIFRNEEQLLGMVLSLGVIEPFLWLKIPKMISVMAVVLGSAFVFLRIKADTSRGKENEFYLFYAGMAVLSGWSLYMPNYLEADPLHGHAYYVSLYNVVHGRAYDDLFTSMYGHYAIFFKWPLKLIGNGNIQDAALLIAILGGLAAFLCMLVIHRFCKNSVVRILGAVASVLPVVGLRLNNYWQVQPHRILFSAIFLAYAVWYLDRRSRGKAIGGYLLAVLAIVWNTETGVVCALSWAALQCYLYLDVHRFWSLKSFGFYGLQVLVAAGSFLGAYGFVNLYNLIHGGTWNSLRTFLYPLLTEEYMTGYLRTNLPTVAGEYMVVLVVFLSAFVWSMLRNRVLNPEDTNASSRKHQLVFFAAILGLGQITYYINRAEYFNLDIIYVIFVILACIFLETAITGQSFDGWKEKSWKEITKINTALVMTVILTALSLATLVQGGHQLNIRAQNGSQDMESVYAFLEELKKDVPINTFGFGQGVPELYSLMGWDTRCHVIDFSDRTELSLQYVRDSLEQEDGFFAFIQDAEFILEEQEGVWYKYKTYEYAGDEYGFFLRQ